MIPCEKRKKSVMLRNYKNKNSRKRIIGLMLNDSDRMVWGGRREGGGTMEYRIMVLQTIGMPTLKYYLPQKFE